MRVLLTASVQSHICQFHKPLMKLLKDRGYEIHVAARNNLKEKNGLRLEYPDKVFDTHFARSPLNIPALFRARRELDEILEQNHYDIIHCNTPVAGVVTRLAAAGYREKGTKVFYTAHGFHFYKGAPWKNWLLYYPIEKWMSRYTDKLITINEEDFELAKSRFHCKVERIHGVGASDERFYPVPQREKEELRRILGVTGNPLIMNVGELLPNKNQKAAVAMMAELIKIYPDALLFIAGNGPERENLERQIADLNLADHVRLLGYTTEVDRYVRACDILAACSYREGLPLNVLEAMMCGKPVVASKNRGHCELVKDGVTGFLVDPDDISAYAEKINMALEYDDFPQDSDVEGDHKSSGMSNDKERICRNYLGEMGLHAVQPYTEKNVRAELERIYQL